MILFFNVKKVLKIIVLSLSLSFPLASISQAADPHIGTGDLKLTSETVGYFKEYIRASNKKPTSFLVSTDGKGSYWSYCPYGQCQGIKKKYYRDECERHYNKECFIFALRRTVKWKNGINTGKAKQAKFKYNLSDAEFDAKLEELGFTGNYTKPKITKKKEAKSSDIATELSSLKKLLDDGILTQDEFDKAKKKILN